MKIDRDAAVAAPVRVTALETLAGVPEQQGAGIEQRETGVRTIGEAAFDNGRDAEPVVPLLERAIRRPGAADELADAPALAAGEGSFDNRFAVRLGGPGWLGSRCASHAARIAIFPKRENTAVG